LFFPRFTRFEEQTTYEFQQRALEKEYSAEDYDSLPDNLSAEDFPPEETPF